MSNITVLADMIYSECAGFIKHETLPKMIANLSANDSANIPRVMCEALKRSYATQTGNTLQPSRTQVNILKYFKDSAKGQ